jgi:uncharacterized protein (TIGR02145 family)
MKKRNQKGMTVIEVLVGIFILSIMIFGVYGMYNYSLKIVREKSRREQALTIANEEIESFRSINYNILGTISTDCAPNPCDLPETKTVTKNGVEYTIITDIRHIDDPFDNVGQDPEGADDTGLNDYKKVKVEVRWGEVTDYDSIVFFSTFAPVGIETACEGGTLKINVFDANAQPVANASVYVKNDNLDPSYENEITTDDNGIAEFKCLEEDLRNNYEITISKLGYSTAQTYPIAPPNNNPDDPHVNIINNKTTEKSFAIDILSILNARTITQDLPNEWTVNDTLRDGETQVLPTMSIGPDDTYYFFWQDSRDGPTRIYGQKFNLPKIAQWGGDVQVSTANDQALPSVAVDESGNSYIAWYHQSTGNQELYIDKIDDDGNPIWNTYLEVSIANQNDDQYNPKMNLEDDENFLYVTFEDNSYDGGDIYSARFATIDAEQEWDNEVKINNDATGNTQTSPATSVDPDTDDLYIVWQDNRLSDNDIWAQKINSYGNYSKEIQISIESDTMADTTDLEGVIAGNLIYRDPNASTFSDSYIFIDANGNEIYDDNGNGTEIKISVENDGFQADTTDLDGIITGALIYEDPSSATMDDSYIYVENETEIRISVESDTITDTTNLNGEINGNLNYSDPDSATANDSYIYVDSNADNSYDNWGQNILINQYSSEEQINPAIAISKEESDTFVYFVWQDYQNNNYDIYMTKFTNNGIRVWETDINLTTEDTTSSDQTQPAIAVNLSNDAIYVAWVDERNGNPDIYMQRFNTSGEAQWVDDIRVENDLIINYNDENNSIQGSPQLAIDSSGKVIVAWHSNDTGDFDIKAAAVVDPTPTPIADVPLRIYGSKTIGKDADENNIYKFDSFFTTDENGELKFDGIDQPKMEWDSYTFEIGDGYNLLLANPSNPISFNPDESSFVCGNPIDYEGQSYATVQIGDQCWMRENLNYDNGCTSITWSDSDVGACSYYAGGPYSNEGLLYQWSAAMNGSTAEGAQGICPAGWHIPTDAQQHTLDDFYDSGTCSESRTNWGCDPAGTELKTVDSTHFSGLLTGYRDTDGSFSLRGSYTRFWSSSESDASAWGRALSSDYSSVYRNAGNKAYGLSVRCIKDDTPTITNDIVLIVRIDIDANVFGFAWSENIGWISFNSDNCDSNDDGFTDTGNFAQCSIGLPISDYGVSIDLTTGNLNRYAWNEKIGWISFNENNPPDGYGFNSNCPNTCDSSNDCTACYDSTSGNVHGWAKILSYSNSWIKFDHGQPGEVYIDASGDWHGWAWNDDVIGWISLNGADAGAGGDYKTILDEDELP